MRSGLRILVAIAALAAGDLGCRASEPVLLVDVKTDLVPGLEFDLVRAERLDGLPVAGAEPRTLEGIDTGVSPENDFVAGRRVAEMEGLVQGDHVIRVRLMAPAPSGGVRQTVLERIALVTVRGNTVVTLVLTRDCRGVVCPGPEDDPTRTACLGGRCVHPACSPETPDACPDPACVDASTCRAPQAACARAACVEGVCLAVARESACPAGEACVPEQGCVPVGEGSTDGGAGVDGGVGRGWPITFGNSGEDTAAVVSPAGADVRIGGSIDPAGSGFQAALLRYDADARPRWTRTFGSGEVTHLHRRAIEGSWVAGFFEATLDLAERHETAGAQDAFVGALTAEGVALWSRTYGTRATDWTCGLTLEPNGRSVEITVSSFSNSLTGESCPSEGGGSGGGGTFIVSAGSIYGEHVSGDGSVISTDLYCAEGPVECEKARDGAGNLYVLVRLAERMDLGGRNYTSRGADDVLVVSYDAAGAVRWAEQLGGPEQDRGFEIRWAGGELVVLGSFSGTAEMGSVTLAAPAGVNHLFLARLDPTAGLTGAHDVGAVEAVLPNALLSRRGQLEVDVEGDAYVGVSFTGEGIVGGVPITSMGDRDIVVTKVGPAGEPRWTRAFGGPGAVDLRDLALGAAGELYVAGSFEGTASFPSGERTAAGGTDGFVDRLSADTGEPLP